MRSIIQKNPIARYRNLAESIGSNSFLVRSDGRVGMMGIGKPIANNCNFMKQLRAI